MVNRQTTALLVLYETCFGKTRHLLNHKDAYIYLHLNESVEVTQQLCDLALPPVINGKLSFSQQGLKIILTGSRLSRRSEISESVVLNQVQF